MVEANKKNKGIGASNYLVLGFLAVIICGGIILRLPISLKDGANVTLLDTLFTATSAVCVTGLIVADTFDTFTTFGQIVIMLLIQFGGLGFSTVAVLLLLAMGRKIDFKGKFYLMEGLNFSTMNDILGIVKRIFIYTLGVEFFGAVVSASVFVKSFGLSKGIYLGVFHAISAFNNAGFDLLGGSKSLVDYNSNVVLNLITMFLIIVGGLGFYIVRDIYNKRSFKRLSLHTKICLIMTTILIFGGGALIYFGEDYTFLESMFMSVSTRTAGFTTVDLSITNQVVLIIMCMLMFIGACPSSTGGGVKTTTFFVCYASIFSAFKNRETQIFKRTVSNDIVQKAFSLVALAAGAIIFSTVAIMYIEGLDFVPVFFETVSAFATVGLSTGITPGLSWASQLFIMALMFLGRLGPITIGYLWIHDVKPGFKYANEKVLIG